MRPDAEGKALKTLSARLHRLAAGAVTVGGASPAKGVIQFFSIRAWTNHLALESLLGAALRAEGYQVRFCTCMGCLPFCMVSSINTPEDHQRPCEFCRQRKRVLIPSEFPLDVIEGVPLVEGGDSVEIAALDTVEKCKAYTRLGVPLGRLCYPSLVWYLRRSRLQVGDVGLYRRILASGAIIQDYVESRMVPAHPACVVMLNGDFFAENVARFVLARAGIRYVTHEYTFEGRVVAALNESVWNSATFDKHRPGPDWVAPLLIKMKTRRMIARWRAGNGYQGYLWKAVWRGGDSSSLRSVVLGVGKDRRVSLFTNLTFESSVIGKERVFQDQFDWLAKVVSHFRIRSDWELVIRIHPAERREGNWQPNESLERQVVEVLGPLPPNVTLVSAGSPVSSYLLAEQSRLSLVYASTLGLELAERGRTVMTAAHVHYAGRGFTMDPVDEAHYFEAIDRIMEARSEPGPPNHKVVVRYMAWLFNRRFVRMEGLQNTLASVPTVSVRNVRQLRRLKTVRAIITLIGEGRAWW